MYTHTHTTAHSFIKRDDWDPSETMTMVQQTAAFMASVLRSVIYLRTLTRGSADLIRTHFTLYISPFSGVFNGG